MEHVKLVSLLDQILVRDGKIESAELPVTDVPSLSLAEKVFHNTKLGFVKLHIVSFRFLFAFILLAYPLAPKHKFG